MLTKMKGLVAASALVAAFGAGSAHAAFTVTYIESGGNVTATGVGSLITTGLIRNRNFDSFGALNPFIQPRLATQIVGGLGFQSYDVSFTLYTSPWGFGSTSADGVGTGGGVYINNNNEGGPLGIIGVPVGYVSGSAISNSAVYAGQTFASLGLNVGRYYYGYGAGANTDLFTVVVAAEPTPLPPASGSVPEPATWGLMLAGFGLVGSALRRRRRHPVVASA